MDEYLKKNRELWNEITPIHARSAFYDVEGFKKGRSTLDSIELEELGDVSGKSLLHLQCHFGLDTLSWARRGAKVTGVDFSDEAITQARSLSEETSIKANFICSNIYDLPDVIEDQFDIIFTSYGVLCWLPDLKQWADVITHFLRPGGTFYIVEFHPIISVFDDSADCTELKIAYSYFPDSEPLRFEPERDYADPNASVTNPSYEWSHSIGEVVTALSNAGVCIEYMHEFPFYCYSALPFMKQDEEGLWRLPGDKMPLTFSIKATKPAL